MAYVLLLQLSGHKINDKLIECNEECNRTVELCELDIHI
jgi:hypothetical protein